jgi:hypothetical protein
LLWASSLIKVDFSTVYVWSKVLLLVWIIDESCLINLWLNERSMGKIEPRVYDVESPICSWFPILALFSISTRSLHFVYTTIDHNLCHAVHCLKVFWRSQW